MAVDDTDHSESLEQTAWRREFDQVLDTFTDADQEVITRRYADEYGHSYTSVKRWFITRQSLPHPTVARNVLTWLKGFGAGRETLRTQA